MTGSDDSAKPPLWIVFAVQAVSVIGDQLGQRASRYDFSHSSRRMLVALSVVSALQVFFFLGVFQLALSPSVTGVIYGSNGEEACYHEVDIQGHKPSYCTADPSRCHQIKCPSQGPFSVPRSVGLHPLLLLNGAINISYYVGEIMLYHHPLGLVLIVMAALAASFIIQPIEKLVGLAVSASVPVSVIALGIGGALFCVVEKHVPASVNLRRVYARWKAVLSCSAPPPSLSDDDSAYRAFNEDEALNGPAGVVAPADKGGSGSGAEPVSMSPEKILDEEKSVGSRFSRLMRVVVPFVVLSLAYGMWFVTQKVFNNEYRTNMFGYTSLDQCLTPFYMLPFLFVVDQFSALRRQCVPVEERAQSFGEAVRSAFVQLFSQRGRGLFTVFMYRLLINGRAMIYFYLSVKYDLNAVYLMLTLVRIVLSWAMALVVCIVSPDFIGLSAAERNTIFHPLNLVLKMVGTALIVGALVIYS